MNEQTQQIIEQTTGVLTSTPSTGFGLLAGIIGYATQDNILFVLTVSVLTAQMISWGYRLVKWLKRRKK